MQQYALPCRDEVPQGRTNGTSSMRIMEKHRHRHHPRIHAHFSFWFTLFFLQQHGANGFFGYAKRAGIRQEQRQEQREQALQVSEMNHFKKRGGKRERLGCGTDRLPAFTDLAGKQGKKVVTVAVAQYGLLRNNCSAYVYEQIFAQLHKSEKYVYVLDHFIHSNEIFAGHETGSVRIKVAGGNPNNAKIDLFLFQNYPECRFATTPQELVDVEVEPQLNKTCGVYGDAWQDKTCGVTLNYLRGLYSQKRVHDTIVAHEHATKRKYDIVVLMRPDVLFTRQLELKYFDETADGLFATPTMHKTFSPDWAQFNGYNDRFFMGARDGVMHVMSRLDNVVKFCDERKRALHSETYMKWVLDTYTSRVNSEHATAGGSGHLFSVQVVHSFYFRRLRANAGLVGAMYFKNSEILNQLPLDKLATCSESELKRYTRDWAL